MQINRALRIELRDLKDPTKFPQNKMLFSDKPAELVMSTEREGEPMIALMKLETGDDVAEVATTFSFLLGKHDAFVTSFPRMWHAVCLRVYSGARRFKMVRPILHLSENEVIVEMDGGQTWTNPKANITGLGDKSAINALVKECKAAEDAVSSSP